MDDLRPLSHAIISVLFVIALVTIPMRIWVRGIAMKSFGWDDWMMASMIVRQQRGIGRGSESRADECFQIFFPCQQGILYFFLMMGGGM